MRSKLLMIAMLPLLAGCGLAYGAGVHVTHTSDAYYYEDAYGGGYDYEYGRRVSLRRLPIPRGYVPAPGRCRVWLPGVAPARQPRSGSCRVMERRVPRGGWLFVRPLRQPQIVELVAYDAHRPVRTRRVYDVRTGRRVNGYY